MIHRGTGNGFLTCKVRWQHPRVRYLKTTLYKSFELHYKNIIRYTRNIDEIFYFIKCEAKKCLQQWLPIITETSKIQCKMIIPQVLDANQSLFLILSSRSSAEVTDKKTRQLLWLLIYLFIY